MEEQQLLGELSDLRADLARRVKSLEQVVAGQRFPRAMADDALFIARAANHVRDGAERLQRLAGRAERVASTEAQVAPADRWRVAAIVAELERQSAGLAADAAVERVGGYIARASVVELHAARQYLGSLVDEAGNAAAEALDLVGRLLRGPDRIALGEAAAGARQEAAAADVAANTAAGRAAARVGQEQAEERLSQARARVTSARRELEAAEADLRQAEEGAAQHAAA